VGRTDLAVCSDHSDCNKILQACNKGVTAA
jgi:hypothetical protein